MGFLSTHKGTTRVVVCLGKKAFKMPRPRMDFTMVLEGCLGNLDEVRRYAEYRRYLRLCPCRALLPFGLLTMMDRCAAYVPEDEAAIQLLRDTVFNPELAALLIEDDHSWYTQDVLARNLGILDGKIVRLDYADVPPR
ncbi:MAG: hypothetical protein EOO77_15665 [Oxalobacteraceae bacterium]|nr:MAG: hypothetical protein EOO77_15665 [Oxalobacteraceae bacterium]